MAIDSQTVVIEATTGAATSIEFGVRGNTPMSVKCGGLAGAETAVVETAIDGTWYAATDSNGAIALTADANTLLLVGPGVYRVAKDATAAAVAVTVAG